MTTAHRPVGQRHLALVGLMGAGKSTVGRRVAKVLGRTFVDADEGYIARYGRTVAEAFAVDGESVFREQEAELVAALVGVGEPLVIATGGGAVLRPSTRSILAGPGCFTVYLHAAPGFLAAKAEAKSHRPLLAEADPVEVFNNLYADRDGWYREVADLVVEVSEFHSESEAPKKAMAAHLAGVYTAAVSLMGGSTDG